MPLQSNRMVAEVRAKQTTSNGTLVGNECWVRGIHFNDTSGGTAGSVVLKDGGSGGPERLHINTPGKGSGEDVVVPAGGIHFDTDVYVELSNVDSVTVFFHR